MKYNNKLTSEINHYNKSTHKTITGKQLNISSVNNLIVLDFDFIDNQKESFNKFIETLPEIIN